METSLSVLDKKKFDVLRVCLLTSIKEGHGEDFEIKYYASLIMVNGKVFCFTFVATIGYFYNYMGDKDFEIITWCLILLF
jgi:hypothetical protein